MQLNFYNFMRNNKDDLSQFNEAKENMNFLFSSFY